MQPHQEHYLLKHTASNGSTKDVTAHRRNITIDMLQLPVSSDDTLHFYRHLHTHIVIANKQFLLLIDVPIQDRSQQITVYVIFTLDIPHGNFTAHYDITTKYLGITKDETMAVELLPHQFQICQAANGQFCTIPTPFQPLAKPPTCLSAFYTRNSASITSRCSLQIKKTSDISTYYLR